MADERIRALSYSVRPAVVAHYFGSVCAPAALLASAPALFAVAVGEWHQLLPALVSPAALALLNRALARGPRPIELGTHEALVVTTAIFAATALSSAAGFALSGIAPLDAVFEAVSGITTTGLSTLGSVEGRPLTFLFARAWLQWYGGLGIVVLSIALAVGPGMAARRLVVATSDPEDLFGGTRLHARRMLVVYLALTVAGVVLLAVLGAGLFDALVYTLAAVSTGGFAPHDASLGGLPGPAVRVAVTALTVAGAVSLPLYDRARRAGPRALLADVELRALLALGALGTAIVGVLGAATGTAPLDALLMTFSAQTTAGFSSVPVAQLGAASQGVLIAAMAVGGSVGSTAGGIKLLRLLVAAAVLRWLFARTRMPASAALAPRLGGERLAPEDVQRALALMALFAATLLVSWLPFLAAGYAPLDALFEVVSAIGTVGLSTGVAAPQLAPSLKAVLCADMFLGRLEIFAVLVSVSPATWLGRRRD